MCCVTDAGKSVDAIDALAVILARVGGALVNVDATVFTSETSGALAAIAVEAVDAASAVHARASSAVINVDLASEAGVSLGHSHWKSLTLSKHTPPLLQGLDAQSSMLVAQ